MIANPYQAPREPASKERRRNEPRGTALVMSLLSIFLACLFGWQLLIVFGFSTMINPKITGHERTRAIIDNFLFHDGLFQIGIVAVLILFTSGAVISCIVHLCCAIFQRPRIRLCRSLTGWGALLVTCVTLATLLIIRS